MSTYQTNIIEDLVRQSQKPSGKKYDFFIFYQSKDALGETIPDKEYACTLQDVLQEEEFMDRKAYVGISNENPVNILETFKQMSESVVVLVVLSEAAIQTFAGNVCKQNNFLLLIQFALKLHKACGVRILALNLMAMDKSDSSNIFFTKFEGWQVRFADSPHPSAYIQDNIGKSMQSLFAIQGININLEDWEFKVPTLFTSLIAAQDELNASGWQSSLKIIPWRSMWGVMITFAISFFLPVVGTSLIQFSNLFRFSKKDQHKKEAHINISLFASGLSLFIFSAYLFGITLTNSVSTLCLYNRMECEVIVRAGRKWAEWMVVTEVQTQCDSCNITEWSQAFSTKCAKCVCNVFHNSGGYCELFTNIFYMMSILTILCFFSAVYCVLLAFTRLNQQALNTNKRTVSKRLSKKINMFKV